MSDQGAGGGIDSSGFLPGHGRGKSDESVPTEAGVETRNPPVKQGGQSEFAAPTQVAGLLPRNFSGHHSTANRAVSDEGLSRNPSTCSSRPMSPHAADPLSHQRRRVEPPVTKVTLSELDVTKIIHNPKLRHDINFDPELHFRPNLDGEKGRRKQEKAREFWSNLEEQLIQFVMNRDEFVQKFGHDGDWCLPSLLKAVKEIIQTLVPARDRSFLDEGLNVDLLIQQFNRGTVDLEKLASWLASVLKQHCAPMRDEWVDEMYNDLSNGNRNNDVGQLVKGMRSLLSVLEAMKLDVANHQIRCLRPVLIEDTVHFEQRFFHRKIQTGKLDIRPARAWYEEARQSASPHRQAQAFGEMDAFFGGLCRLVLPSTDIAVQAGVPVTAHAGGPGPISKVPNTFVFDEERLLKLRSDMWDAINLEICMRVYEQDDRHTQQAFARSISSCLSDGQHSQRTSMSSDSSSDLVMSRPSSFVLGSSDSDHSSRRSSSCLFGNQPVDFAEAKMKSRSLYSSLVALLHTAPPAAYPAHRWANLVPSIAVQVFRFLNAPPSALQEIEGKLRTSLLFDSPLYKQVEEIFSDRLRTELAGRVKEFKNLSGIGLFSIATGGRGNGAARAPDQLDSLDGAGREAREEGGIDDIATRLAHLGILHWRVWAQLAYADGSAVNNSSSQST